MSSELVYSTSSSPDGEEVWFAASMPELELGDTYNIQCLRGHVWTAEPGSSLEQRCIEREKKGYLDALVGDADECPECREYSEAMNDYYDFVSYPDPYYLMGRIDAESDESPDFPENAEYMRGYRSATNS